MCFDTVSWSMSCSPADQPVAYQFGHNFALPT
uniref:Uncharacterized protein n=1 Tax=Anguilla anguilla TaxID=7936 RepID=A0A0E9TN84_ANGAN